MFAVGMLASSCSSDDDNADNSVDSAITDVSNAVDSTVDSVANAVDSTADSVAAAADSMTDGTGDEGMAKDIGQELVTALSSSSTGGEPMMTTINSIVPTVVNGRAEITGLEDNDNDGKDDDAKFTVATAGGDDKACVQSQDGAWEVTDDEC